MTDFMMHQRFLDPALNGDSQGDAAADPVWLHVNVAEEGAAKRLLDQAPYLDSTVAGILCAPDTRPHVEDFGKEYLIILRGMNLNPQADADDMVSLRIWCDGTRVVSAERRPVMAVRKQLEKMEDSTGPMSAAEVVVGLAVYLIENMGGPIDGLLEKIDALEIEALEGKPGDLRSRINHLREQVLYIRRYLVPMKQAVAQLQSLAQEWGAEKAARRLRQASDHLARHIEDLDAARDQLQFQHEEMVAAISDRLNRNMYTLSIVAAIFLPLGFLTGLLGINVGGMPGADDGTAFWWVAGGCATIAVLQLLYFRRGGWF
ncbi:MAG: zinc transporter ZntB [Alphaproteobacteria bacterium]|nr:zinc transporter ZntB [Alphaproteobacteria bacterium]